MFGRTRVTHTVAILEVSQESYQEIRRLLEEMNYTHAFTKGSDGNEYIDMTGIGLQALADQSTTVPVASAAYETAPSESARFGMD